MEPNRYIARSPEPSAAPDGRLDKLSTTARGWHTVQMAVLGFIGICGILHSSDGSAPRLVQVIAGILSAVAFGLALLSVLMVGRVAYPITPGTGDAGLARARGQLRNGIRTTVAALALIVLATLSGWWPHPTDAAAGGASVAISDANGQTWCGSIVPGPDDAISLQTANGVVAVPAQMVAQLRAVTTCP
jgi:hypothetical protein